MINRFFASADKHIFKKLPISQISKNPNQPRKIFDQGALLQLEESIKSCGIITPLTVRKTETGYELVAGERRLRAAKMAGLDQVPCYIIEADDEKSSLMALIENLQRRDLDCFEEAQSLQRLTSLYGMTQQQAAERIGKTQSAVANKLRLLRLAPETVSIVRQNHLTERHARALLRIEDEESQIGAARHVVDGSLNVDQTEKYIDRLLEGPTAKQSRKVVLVRDVRIFINTVDNAVKTMRRAGVKASVSQHQDGDNLVMTVVIPRSPSDVMRPRLIN